MGMTTAVVVLVALGLDALLGWPRWLYGLVGHPVSWIGGLVGRLDRWLNLADARPEERRLAGAVAALAVTGLSVECALLIGWLMPEGWVGALLTGVVAWPLIAMRSMHDHVVDVLTPLKAHDLERAPHERGHHQAAHRNGVRTGLECRRQPARGTGRQPVRTRQHKPAKEQGPCHTSMAH